MVVGAFGPSSSQVVLDSRIQRACIPKILPNDFLDFKLLSLPVLSLPA